MSQKEIENKILALFKNPKTRNEGFNLLVDNFKKPLYFQIRRILISHESTNDVLQEVFIKCWKKLNGFHHNSKLSTWLYKIAYNESLQWLRKEKNNKHIDLENISLHNIPSANIFNKDADEISKKLEMAIIQLPTKQKMVFQLKYYKELSYKEIQEVTGGSIGGLKVTYHHAMIKIKKILLLD